MREERRLWSDCLIFRQKKESAFPPPPPPTILHASLQVHGSRRINLPQDAQV